MHHCYSICREQGACLILQDSAMQLPEFNQFRDCFAQLPWEELTNHFIRQNEIANVESEAMQQQQHRLNVCWVKNAACLRYARCPWRAAL